MIECGDIIKNEFVALAGAGGRPGPRLYDPRRWRVQQRQCEAVGGEGEAGVNQQRQDL